MIARTLGMIVPLALLLCASTLGAQAPVINESIPAEVRQSLFEHINDPSVMRLSGGAEVPAGAHIDGDIAVLAGSVRLEGEVTGDLLIVNGDLHLFPTAAVGGQVIVVGGSVSGAEEALVSDGIVVYLEALRYRVREGRVEPLPDEGFAPGFLTQDLGFGRVRMTVRAGPNYNRIEGLPVRFGPVIQTVGSNPLTLEALGIWRSESGLHFESDRLGYFFRVRQALGGRGTAYLGASAYDEVSPIEGRELTNAEASLATFLLRRDFRDYYQREGWSAFLDLRPTRLPFDATLRYREERHHTPLLGSPWTLGDGDRAWRPLPLAGEGRIRSVELDLGWDSRNDPMEPSQGWRVNLGLKRQVGGELRLPPVAVDAVLPAQPQDPLPAFTRAFLDVRQYARVGPTSRLNLRAVAGGALTGGPLPPQFQMAPGGEGSLPGHPRFALDCGARESTGLVRPDDEGEGVIVYPAYGCDRILLAQAEFLGSLPFAWGLPDEWTDSELARAFELRPAWSVFLNAGQGWARGEAGHPIARPDSETRADVGVGFYLGPVGLHWSYPLNRRDRGLNFFIRLQQRF